MTDNKDALSALKTTFDAIEAARRTFRIYADMHRAKQPSDYAKVKRNEEMHDLMEAAGENFYKLEKALTSLPDAQGWRSVDYMKVLDDACWDLRCQNIPTGGDDYDISWYVIEHHMGEPHEREIGRGRTPKAAMDDAMKPQPAKDKSK